MCVSFFASPVHVGAPCRMKVLARFISSGCSFPTWPDQDSSEDFSVLDDQMPCPVLAPRPSPPPTPSRGLLRLLPPTQLRTLPTSHSSPTSARGRCLLGFGHEQVPGLNIVKHHKMPPQFPTTSLSGK